LESQGKTSFSPQGTKIAGKNKGGERVRE